MSHRIERLGNEMRKSIINIIANELDNPDIAAFSFDISKVVLAGDLKTAKVPIKIFGDNAESKKKTFEAIKLSAAFIKKRLSSEFSEIRTVPTLTFVLDDSMEHSSKIEAILREIKKNEQNS